MAVKMLHHVDSVDNKASVPCSLAAACFDFVRVHAILCMVYLPHLQSSRPQSSLHQLRLASMPFHDQNVWIHRHQGSCGRQHQRAVLCKIKLHHKWAFADIQSWYTTGLWWPAAKCYRTLLRKIMHASRVILEVEMGLTMEGQLAYCSVSRCSLLRDALCLAVPALVHGFHNPTPRHLVGPWRRRPGSCQLTSQSHSFAPCI